MKKKTMNQAAACLAGAVLCVAAGAGLTGCGSSESVESVKARAVDSEPTPEEKKFLAAARPFLDAIIARDYAGAFGHLSKDARASMNLNQFVPPLDDAQFERNRAKALSNVKPAEFKAWMEKAEAEYGVPYKVQDASVFSTDPEVLAGKGEALDSMFAIGGMPKFIPTDIRRASLRCRLGTRLSASQLQEAAKQSQVTVEALQKDPDFSPFLTLKVVLVEEEGALKVGYFEFLPPSIFD